MTTTAWPTRTTRFVGRCTGCKKVQAETVARGWNNEYRICACGKRVTLKQVMATVSRTECGPKCTGAVGPACDCKCGGENHSAGHGEA